MTNLKIATLNVWGTRGDWPDRREVLRREFAELGPDLITLQETVATAEYDQVQEFLDPEIAEGIKNSLLQPRVDGCVERLQKAQKDGRLRVDVEPEDVVELLYAPLYYRLLLHTGPVTEDQVDTILDLTFGGLEPQ